MAFQFKRDPSENLTLTLAGDIDLEVTPDIKGQMNSQLGDARSLTIDAANVSYLDSSGVSILVIAMQSCKQKSISLAISKISDEAMRVLQLAKLDKILPIQAQTGPARMVDVDVFSGVGERDSAIVDDLGAGGDARHSDDDLIAAISSGEMAGGGAAAAPEPAADPEPVTEIEMTPEPAPTAAPAQPAPAPAADPAPAAAPDAAPAADDAGGGDPSGGSFTPGTF